MPCGIRRCLTTVKQPEEAYSPVVDCCMLEITWSSEITSSLVSSQQTPFLSLERTSTSQRFVKFSCQRWDQFIPRESISRNNRKTSSISGLLYTVQSSEIRHRHLSRRNRRRFSRSFLPNDDRFIPKSSLFKTTPFDNRVFAKQRIPRGDALFSSLGETYEGCRITEGKKKKIPATHYCASPWPVATTFLSRCTGERHGTKNFMNRNSATSRRVGVASKSR